ncbi:hypothetical protein IPF86_01720 [Candidatus Nomurabacteria bacterium]|jgi:hypothetical protein|nr:MAG: hypothetical protein IPF86_01720 [Candidatus Nomurabacteria bacterium]
MQNQTESFTMTDLMPGKKKFKIFKQEFHPFFNGDEFTTKINDELTPVTKNAVTLSSSILPGRTFAPTEC